MGIKGIEKTQAKKEIMKLLNPWLTAAGFKCAIGGKTGGIFELTADDGAKLILTIQAPTFNSFFRMWGGWEMSNGKLVAQSGHSDVGQYPDLFGRRRYNFKFNRSTDTHERCAENMKRWISNELMPWFKKRPTTSWYD